MHALRSMLQFDERGGTGDRGLAFEQFAPVLAHQQRAFGGAVRVAEADAQQEAVELALG